MRFIVDKDRAEQGLLGFNIVGRHINRVSFGIHVPIGLAVDVRNAFMRLSKHGRGPLAWTTRRPMHWPMPSDMRYNDRWRTRSGSPGVAPGGPLHFQRYGPRQSYCAVNEPACNPQVTTGDRCIVRQAAYHRLGLFFHFQLTRFVGREANHLMISLAGQPTRPGLSCRRAGNSPRVSMRRIVARWMPSTRQTLRSLQTSIATPPLRWSGSSRTAHWCLAVAAFLAFNPIVSVPALMRVGSRCCSTCRNEYQFGAPCHGELTNALSVSSPFQIGPDA